MTDTISPEAKAIQMGDRLRMRRRVRQLSLKELADKTGLSIGLLSQIERNISTPSLRSLRMICEALNMPASWLFDAPQSTNSEVVIRPSARRRLDLSPTGIVKELLTSDITPEVQMMRVLIEPGALFEGIPSSKPGVAKCGFVVKGSGTLRLGSESFALKAGDSFSFHANQPHNILCDPDTSAEVLWVVSPALY